MEQDKLDQMRKTVIEDLPKSPDIVFRLIGQTFVEVIDSNAEPTRANVVHALEEKAKRNGLEAITAAEAVLVIELSAAAYDSGNE